MTSQRPFLFRRRFFSGLVSATLVSLVTAFGISTASAADVEVDTKLGQSVLPAGKAQRIYLRVALKGAKPATNEERTPVNVALVLDRSGSMEGEKLAQAKEAAIMALDRLAAEDVISIVTYDHTVDAAVPATKMTDRDRLVAKIRDMEAGGRTALYAGVEQGLREVKKFLANDRINRVILLSDGLANVGPSTPAELGRLGQKAAGDGVSITTIGLGLGYNEDLMARLAGASDGNHAFVEHPDQLVDIFNKEFGDVLSVVAQEITIIIECRSGFTPKRVLGRDADISGQRVELKLNQVYGGQEKYAIVEIEVPAGQAVGEVSDIASVDVGYTSMSSKAREAVKETVDGRFSDSAEEAEASIDKTVMTAVTTQIANETSEQAVMLRDQGDIAAAKELLEKNADYLNTMAGKLAAPELSGLGQQNLDNANALSEEDWTKSRKEMRAQQHKQKYQQKY